MSSLLLKLLYWNYILVQIIRSIFHP